MTAHVAEFVPIRFVLFYEECTVRYRASTFLLVALGEVAGAAADLLGLAEELADRTGPLTLAFVERLRLYVIARERFDAWLARLVLAVTHWARAHADRVVVTIPADLAAPLRAQLARNLRRAA